MSQSRFCQYSDNGNGEKVNAIMNNNDDIDEEKDEGEYLQDMPYSSSSFDRSSIGSIPWADDAIKQNQMDWEQVERWLSGEENLPLTIEPDLRNEILEWQEKFPQLLGKKTFCLDGEGEAIADLNHEDILSSLSFQNSENDSDDGDRYDDEQVTPTSAPAPPSILQGTTANSPQSHAKGLSTKLELLRITATPLLRDHQQSQLSKEPRQSQGKRFSVSSENRGHSISLRLHKISPNIPQQQYLRHSGRETLHKQSKTYEVQPIQQFRMPPILNVLDGKKRFRNLAPNKSFVQLTRVPSANHTTITKSAAIIRHSDSGSSSLGLPHQLATPPHPITFQNSYQQTAWQRPLMATRVSNHFNNRNAIILPSLNTSSQQKQEHRRNSTLATKTSSSSSMSGDGGTTRTISLMNSKFLGSTASSSADVKSRTHYLAGDRFVSRWQHLNADNHRTSVLLGGTRNSTNSMARSVSAAIRHIGPRMDARDYNSDLFVPSYISYSKHDGYK